MGNKTAIAKAHLKTIAIMSVLLGFMGSIIAWPQVVLKVMVAGAGIAFLALVYLAIYCSIRDKQRGKLSDPD